MMKLIPQWRRWWRRHSTWILAASGALGAAVQFMPQVREYIDPETYNKVMLVLLPLTFVVLHIKQDTVSGDKP